MHEEDDTDWIGVGVGCGRRWVFFFTPVQVGYLVGFRRSSVWEGSRIALKGGCRIVLLYIYIYALADVCRT